MENENIPNSGYFSLVCRVINIWKRYRNLDAVSYGGDWREPELVNTLCTQEEPSPASRLYYNGDADARTLFLFPAGFLVSVA